MGGGDSGSSSSNEVTPTADMVAQQSVNAQLWNYYQTDYKPIVDKYIAKTTDPSVTKEEANQMAGKINAEAIKNIKPGDVSSNPVANENKLNRVGKTETGMQMQGQGAVRSRKLSELQNIVDIGQGQTTTAAADLNQLAGQSVESEISNVEIQQEEQGAIENAYGSMAGAVAGGLIKGTSKSTANPRQLNPNPYDWKTSAGISFGET